MNAEPLPPNRSTHGYVFPQHTPMPRSGTQHCPKPSQPGAQEQYLMANQGSYFEPVQQLPSHQLDDDEVVFGQANEPGSYFCPHCGPILPQSPQKPMAGCSSVNPPAYSNPPWASTYQQSDQTPSYSFSNDSSALAPAQYQQPIGPSQQPYNQFNSTACYNPPTGYNMMVNSCGCYPNCDDQGSMGMWQPQPQMAQQQQPQMLPPPTPQFQQQMQQQSYYEDVNATTRTTSGLCCFEDSRFARYTHNM